MQVSFVRLFYCDAGEAVDIDMLMVQYVEIAKRHKIQPRIIKAHLFHSLYAGLQRHTDLRDTLGKVLLNKSFNF